MQPYNDSPHQLVERGRALRTWLGKPFNQHHLFITLATNTGTTPSMAFKTLNLWYQSFNNKTVSREFYKLDPDELWNGWAFLEGNDLIEGGKETLHWHLMLRPGIELPNDKYLALRRQTADGKPEVAENIARLWKRGRPARGPGRIHHEAKGFEKGTVDVQFITDHPGCVAYCTKDLCRYGPHLVRAHNYATPLPLKR